MRPVNAHHYLMLVLALIAVTPAYAAPIFSQTPSLATGFHSDRDFGSNGFQTADEFTLSSDAMVESVTWRGVFLSGNTPVMPVAFDLLIYGDNGSDGPDLTNILSQTSVSFDSLSQTGRTLNVFVELDEYEFHADINEVALTAGTQYWFSPLANTDNDGNDDFIWSTDDSNQLSASRNNVTSNVAFSSNSLGDFYFTLDGTPSAVPVPMALPAGVVLLGVLGVVRGRGRQGGHSSLARGLS